MKHPKRGGWPNSLGFETGGKDLSAQGPTVMVGDGVNDAISLAAADVGVSIGHTKADLAIKSSDIIVLRDDARDLLAIIKMGKKLIRVIKQNYAWAVGFNTVGIVLATAGVLSPWLAALFHHISSVTVVFNSARLVHNKITAGERSWGPNRNASPEEWATSKPSALAQQKMKTKMKTMKFALIFPNTDWRLAPGMEVPI
jgi:hypothetical protein